MAQPDVGRPMAAWWLALVAPVLAVLMAACGRPGGPDAAAGPGGGAAGAGGAGSVRMDPGTQQAVDAAMALAVGHQGVPRDQLRLVRVERRQWSDASLGCPAPDMMYAQVITPGYLVVLSGGGRDVEYHTDTRGRAVTC